jgi:hypothetical protein
VCKVDFMPVIFMWNLGFKNSIYVVERRGNSVFWGLCVNFKLVLQRLKEWIRCAIFMGCSFGSYSCVGWFLSYKCVKAYVNYFELMRSDFNSTIQGFLCNPIYTFLV